MIFLTEKAKEAIEEEIEFYVGIEDETLQVSDMGLILFVRKQSCSPITEGGHKEIGVGVEPTQKYLSNEKFSKVETLNELHDIPVFIEKAALEMLEGRPTIEIDSRGALEKELLIRDGPVVDLGSCRVTFSRKK
ncbi:MAG: hypothetical protein HWN65_15015 [Candidatus Helarchaeota archaeon]|nr:hypothetical protein [Candidatus Helarchaeota archaeon]